MPQILLFYHYFHPQTAILWVSPFSGTRTYHIKLVTYPSKIHIAGLYPHFSNFRISHLHKLHHIYIYTYIHTYVYIYMYVYKCIYIYIPIGVGWYPQSKSQATASLRATTKRSATQSCGSSGVRPTTWTGSLDFINFTKMVVVQQATHGHKQPQKLYLHIKEYLTIKQ